MIMENTLRVLNEMRDAEVIGRYAIGGAVAAFFYIEPGTTFDLDIFMAWEPSESGLLDLGSIYGYLMARGYVPKEESIIIEGWAVQFLPAGNPLIQEALEEAVAVEIEGVPTHIFTKEHLMAICLQTGRPKDVARLVQFTQEGRPDREKLLSMIDRHHLREKWDASSVRFDSPL
jgi:hypothetical protein